MMLDPMPPQRADLQWRPISRADLPALVMLAQRCFATDGGVHFLFEPDQIAVDYFSDNAEGIGAFSADGTLVACTTVRNPSEPLTIIVGLVHPHWRRQGIGDYLMRWSQVQALQHHPHRLQIRTETLNESAHKLYRKHRFAVVRSSRVMRCDLDAPLVQRLLPPALTLTAWHPDLAQQFYDAYFPAFRERPGFPNYTLAEWVDSWTNDHFVPEWSLLARENGVSVGFVTASVSPPHAFIIQVGVIPTQRRRGYCSLLILESMRKMQKANFESCQLIVDLLQK